MLQKFEVDFGAASAEERLDLWADTVRPLFFVSSLGETNGQPATVARGWMLDRLVFCEAAFGAQVSHRSRRNHVAQSADAIVLQTYLRGNQVGEIAGEPMRIGVDEVNVTDYSRGHIGRSTPTHVHSVVIAHDLVGYDPSRHPPVMRFGTETVVGRVLRHTLLAIHADLEVITEAEAPRIANGFIGLLRSILFSEPSVTQTAPDFAAARARAIRAYVDAHVDAHVGAGRLTVDAIAARFGTSRATLYRDFKAEGGVERFIIGRRLEAALSALAFGAEERGAVSRAAERYGFASAAHFSREFRSRFGITPSDVVGGRMRPELRAGGEAAHVTTGPGDTLERFLRGM